MYHIGVDLGGTNIAAGITDENYLILKGESVPTLADRGADAVLQDIARLCQDLMKNSGLELSDFGYLGIAAPGIANQNTGVIEYNNNLGFINVPIARKLREILGFQNVLLENDANAAALGEALAGAGKGAEIFVMVTLGTGVGSGVVIQGKILRGINHTGGEMGHMVIERRCGRKCTCGRTGCWEAYNSSYALIKRTQETMQQFPSSKMWELCHGNLNLVNTRTAFQGRILGDMAATMLIEEYMDDLACGLSNVINIFDPDIVCLGGGLSQEGSVFLELLVPRISQETYGYQVDKTAREERRVRLAQLGNNAGWIGAAWLDGE